MYRRLLIVEILTLLASAAAASTWSVQRDGTGDFTAIQPALDVAADGDTILIGPGEYTEATTIRPPGWAYDIQTYADLRCDDLTIIGAGADVTVIGPATYQGNAATGNPAGLSYGGGGTLRISDVGIRHSYAMYVIGILYMDRCRLANNTIGLSWNPSGPGGWVRDSVFEATESIFDPESFEIGYGGLGASIVLERNRFESTSVVRGVNGMTIRDCDLSVLHVYSGAQVYVDGCRPGAASAGILLGMGAGNFCSVTNSELRDPQAALWVDESSPGGRFVVQNSRIEGGSYALFYAGYNAGSCEVRNCDLAKGAGPIVRCGESGPSITHDMRDNYWGTTDEATIQSWIVDHSDNPQIGATVFYSPFAGQSVPTESTSWGDLKALFR